MGSIAEAQSRAAGNASSSSPVAASAPVASAPAVAATAAATAADVAVGKLEGYVELDPKLRGQVADTDAVFIFARAASGPKFPIAVLRKQVKDLPVSFVLDDNMSMVEGSKISNFPQLVVGARISKTGDATASVGDLEGISEAVKPGAAGMKIVINTQRK